MSTLVFGDVSLDAHETDAGDPWERSRSGLYVPARRRRPLRALDLFAGCGGFSLGMQTAGINVVAAAEWSPLAVMTYLLNLGSRAGCALAFVADGDREQFYKALHKAGEDRGSGWIGRHNGDRTGGGCRAMVMGDVAQMDAETLLAPLREIGEPTEIDIVIGGPPCQGISRANTRSSPKDPRNNLVLEFWRLADEVGATAVIMENVPPLLTDKAFRPLRDELVRRANAAGFDVVANVLDAASYGVPQHRRRALFVGTRGAATERPFSFPMPTHWSFGSTSAGQWEQRIQGTSRDKDPEPEAQQSLFAEGVGE